MSSIQTRHFAQGVITKFWEHRFNEKGYTGHRYSYMREMQRKSKRKSICMQGHRIVEIVTVHNQSIPDQRDIKKRKREETANIRMGVE